MKNGTRVLALGLVLCMALTGCSNNGVDLLSIKAEDYASEAEVIDYYTEALSYDTIAKRTTEVNRVVYETAEVSEATRTSLIAIAKEIQAELGAEDWSTSFHVSKYQHQYIKYLIDDKAITLMNCPSVTTALGYFFVDFEYKIAPQGCASFTENSKYVGISGAYKRDYVGSIEIDEDFMAVANLRVLEYCQDNGVTAGTQVIPDGNSDTQRVGYYDVNLYNSVAGSSLTQTAFMPPIKMVITPAAPVEGASISGYGMYPQGKFDLADFGYNRSELSGTMVLRYVFKQNIVEPEKVDFVNVYCTKYTLDNRLDGMGSLVNLEDESSDSEQEGATGNTEETGDSTENAGVEAEGDTLTPEEVIEENKKAEALVRLTVPQFAQTEIEKLIERYDRAICNGDMEALLGGTIYDDVGLGYLWGFYINSCYGKRHMSDVVEYLAKVGNKYLIDVESTIQESPINTNQTGTYVQKAYMVVEQQGLEFKLKDLVIYDFKMAGEPQLDVDSNILKQLAALNLQGEVPEGEKSNICALLGKLYSEGTARSLSGIYSCFDSDTTILSSKQYEYLNSQLRGWLVKMGTETPTTYRGQVSEWLGGSAEQAEFTTEELITYEGKDKAQYMEVYYLVSKYGGTWVIDDMQVLDSQIITAEEAETISERITDYSVDGGNMTDTVRDFGELVLSAVVTTEGIDDVSQEDLPVDPDTLTEPTGTGTEQNNGTGTEDETGGNEDVGTGNTGTSSGSTGEYVWSDKLNDWIWQTT